LGSAWPKIFAIAAGTSSAPPEAARISPSSSAWVRRIRLLEHLIASGGTLAFMSSHRGSVSMNSEGGLELYGASKAALNMLARGIWAPHRKRGLTVLSIHPGWPANPFNMNSFEASRGSKFILDRAHGHIQYLEPLCTHSWPPWPCFDTRYCR
jgi:NAD(P)-dependent dehydrogenase (short-subunit alcohol dehydrogenase family)